VAWGVWDGSLSLEYLEKHMNGAPFTILERLADRHSMRQMSAADLRILANELEASGDYQALVGYREGDDSDRIEIFVSYPKKRE
jgi:hypothetical protein